MTFPHSPFPDETDLFPHWTVVLQYLKDYALRWGLYNSSKEDWEQDLRGADPGINGRPTYSNHDDGRHYEEILLRPSNTPADVAQRELPRRILCNRELYSATWVGSTELGKGGRWRVVSKPFPRGSDDTEEFEDDIDAIIDATGHLVHPSIPTFEGQDEWLAAQPGRRRITHSAFYRGPEAFRDQRVVIIGAGPSGLDGSLQIGRTAKKVIVVSA